MACSIVDLDTCDKSTNIPVGKRFPFIHFKAHGTHDIFAHIIAIKRYCNSKIERHFSSNYYFSFPVWIENIYFWTIMLIET